MLIKPKGIEIEMFQSEGWFECTEINNSLQILTWILLNLGVQVLLMLEDAILSYVLKIFAEIYF